MFLAWSVGLRLALATCRQSREEPDRWFAWKTRIFILLSFKCKLLCSIQALTLLTQASSLSLVSSRSPASEFLNAQYFCVSSAYWWKETSWWLIMSPSGAVYILYCSGPSTEPWGTPQVNGQLVDRSLPMDTNCFLSARYDVNYWQAAPCITKRLRSLWRRVWWSTASNAADKSSINRTTVIPSSIETKTSFCTLNKADCAVTYFIGKETLRAGRESYGHMVQSVAVRSMVHKFLKPSPAWKSLKECQWVYCGLYV